MAIMRTIAALLLLCASLRVAFACQLDGIDWQWENALQQLLTNCQRPAEEGERRHYTWGHEEKVALLTHQGYGLFRFYNDAQQFSYAGFQARSFIQISHVRPAGAAVAGLPGPDTRLHPYPGRCTGKA